MCVRVHAKLHPTDIGHGSAGGYNQRIVNADCIRAHQGLVRMTVDNDVYALDVGGNGVGGDAIRALIACVIAKMRKADDDLRAFRVQCVDTPLRRGRYIFKSKPFAGAWAGGDDGRGCGHAENADFHAFTFNDDVLRERFKLFIAGDICVHKRYGFSDGLFARFFRQRVDKHGTVGGKFMVSQNDGVIFQQAHGVDGRQAVCQRGVDRSGAEVAGIHQNNIFKDVLHGRDLAEADHAFGGCGNSRAMGIVRVQDGQRNG